MSFHLMQTTMYEARMENENKKSYVPRDPSQTVLYQAVAQHYNSFITMVEDDPDRNGLPEFVKNEFEEYLKCGILAHGFTRHQCTLCKKNLFVAFSCKKRGFCLSCSQRRCSEVATHLVDNVLPDHPIRQWVLSLPWTLRYLCATSVKTSAAVNRILSNEVRKFLMKRVSDDTGFEENKLHGGTITWIQRFGGSLNLNLHFHMVALDGTYFDDSSGESPMFLKARKISTEDVEMVLLGDYPGSQLIL